MNNSQPGQEKNLDTFVDREFEETKDGKYDEHGFYRLPDNSYWDPDGIYFNKDGNDKHGGFYDEKYDYHPGKGWIEEMMCYAEELDHHQDMVVEGVGIGNLDHLDDYNEEDDLYDHLENEIPGLIMQGKGDNYNQKHSKHNHYGNYHGNHQYHPQQHINYPQPQPQPQTNQQYNVPSQQFNPQQFNTNTQQQLNMDTSQKLNNPNSQQQVNILNQDNTNNQTIQPKDDPTIGETEKINVKAKKKLKEEEKKEEVTVAVSKEVTVESKEKPKETPSIEVEPDENKGKRVETKIEIDSLFS